MNKPTYYLIGGGEFDDPIKQRVEFIVLKQLDWPARVLIIPWTTDDLTKQAKYRPQMIALLEQCNVSSVEYLEEDESSQITDNKFAEANVLYLPGGSPEVLMSKLSKHNLFFKISNFHGSVLGISAGAYVLTREYIDINPNPVTIMPASNLINIDIKCHYTETMDEKLYKLSTARDIYAIPNNAALVYQNNKLHTIGHITLFRKGKKDYLTSWFFH